MLLLRAATARLQLSQSSLAARAARPLLASSSSYASSAPASLFASLRAMATTMGSPSIISMINQDHAKFKNLWNEYQGPNMNGEMKQKLGWALIREIAMHSSAEEEVMYPEIRKRLGDQAADMLLGQDGHQHIKDLLTELDRMTVEKDGEAAYTAKLKQAMDHLYHHIDDEENKVWPQFCALPGVDADLLSHLGKKFEGAKAHAVTRPHPWAPNKPPLNVIANMATAPLDAAADMWRFAGHPPTM
ncbi:hypothetical protein CHLRE_16g670750v5 [Chlamydomonas reinhardtii]|uniref:Hemerythrin-like domain-containing protein n=1 Tax=Chlamydomonas reinhardtii TaxID=3055 RepID=A0A2K3CUI5_CHLRE|nr:uncharacterized protein CHLRE_16g670750v5 [Chlamydomonas reinhardtii]PNW71941.1 hypothetical protein CHLRE_16g670750v5 [Chlamydomonas reinhardtii]